MQPDDLAVEIIVDLLQSHTGQHIAPDRRWRVAPALSNLLRERSLPDLPALIVQLTESDDEDLARMVVEALLNNETYFFRDRQVFDHIGGTILPRLAKARADRKELRIWSVGCSTGQEPLSLAMLFAEQPSLWRDWSIDILATDVSQSVVQFARTALYSNFQIQRGLGVSQMLGFFTETPGGWQARDRLTKLIRFDTHNMLEPAPHPAEFDLILCRNVLLYFDDSTRNRALGRLGEALAEDGCLVLGGGELVMDAIASFQPDPDRSGVYTQKSAKFAGAGAW